MSSKKLGVYLAVFFLMLIPVLGVTIQGFPADINILEWQKESEPCITATYEFFVTNTETVPVLYNITVSGIEPSWALLSKQLFALMHGKTQSISVFITPPCEVYGQQKITVNIGANGVYARLPLDLNILRNYNYSISVGEYVANVEKPETPIFNETNKSKTQTNETEEEEVSKIFVDGNGQYNLCNAQEYAIPIKVKNLVDIGNIFRLKVEGEEWASLKNPGIAMYGKQEGIVDLLLKPAFDTGGNFTFNILAKSERGELEEKKQINVTIRDCYGISLNSSVSEDTVCNHNKQNYTLTIENNGQFNEDVELSVNGKCASLSEELVNIVPGRSKKINLVIDEECDVVGEEIIGVGAWLKNFPELSGQNQIKLTFVPIDDCFKTEITGGTLYVFTSEPRYFKIKNHGTKSADYSISLTAPNWVDVNPKQLSLYPGAEADMELMFNLRDDITQQRYKLTVTANANNKVEYSRNLIAVIGDETLFDVLAYYWVYTTTGIVILFLVIIILVLYIRNKRRVYFEKRFELIGKDEPVEIDVDEEMALQQIKFNAKEELEKIKISVEKLRRKPTRKKPCSLVYEYLNISKKNIKDNDIADTYLVFKVNKKWLEENNLKQTHILLKRFDQKWKEFDAVRVKSDGHFVYYKSYILKFGVYAICAKEIEKPVIVMKTEVSKKELPLKKVETRLKEAQKPKEAYMFLKFVVVLVVLYLAVLGIFTGFIYYIIGGLFGIVIIISILHFSFKNKPEQITAKLKAEEKMRKEEEKRLAKENKKKDKLEKLRLREEEKKREEEEKMLKEEQKEKEKIKKAELKAVKEVKEKSKFDVFGFFLIAIVIAAIVLGIVYGYLYYVIAGIIGIVLLILVLLVIERYVSKKSSVVEETAREKPKQAELKAPKEDVKKKKMPTSLVLAVIAVILVLIIGSVGYYFAPSIIGGLSSLKSKIVQQIEIPQAVDEDIIMKVEPEKVIEVKPAIIKQEKNLTEERLKFLKQTLEESVTEATVERVVEEPRFDFTRWASDNLDYIVLAFLIVNLLIIIINFMPRGGIKKFTSKIGKAIVDFFLEEEENIKRKP